MSSSNKNDKYPISVNKHQCIGPCYYKGTKIIHPKTLDEVTNNENFCPIDTVLFEDSSGKRDITDIDYCYAPTAHKTNVDSMFTENVLTPQFVFSSTNFLKLYYNINSLDDLLNWLDKNKQNPYKNKERVFNNGLVAYGSDITMIDHRLIHFINDIMLENLPKLYKNIKKYIYVNDNVITLSKDLINESKDDKEDIALIRKYIKDKFLGIDNVNKFMSKFIRYYKEDITNRYISELMVDHMIDYIIKRINMTDSDNNNSE